MGSPGGKAGRVDEEEEAPLAGTEEEEEVETKVDGFVGSTSASGGNMRELRFWFWLVGSSGAIEGSIGVSVRRPHVRERFAANGW